MTILHQTFLTLAQAASDGPGLPGAAAPAAPAAGGTAGTAAGASGAAAPASGNAFMLMMLVVLGAMVLFTFMNGRREKKKREELLGNIKKHDRVLTIGGVIGTVVEVKDDAVILKVDETSNTRITFTKSAVSQVMQSDKATA
jgi:preprotein translocase subunit YajC